jgi:uncharacterized protein
VKWFSPREAAKRPLPEFLHVPWNVGDVGVMILAWFGIQIGVVLLLKILAPSVPGVDDFLRGVSSGSNIMGVFVLDLVDAAAGLGVVALYLRKYRTGFKTLGWRRTDLGRAVLYLVIVLIFFVFASAAVLTLVSLLLPGFNADQAQNNDFIGAAAGHQSLALIALVLLPPVLEETIFRGFMFPAMAKKWGVIPGALVSSAVFGIAHFQANISIYTFLLGLLLCFMYVRLKSIFPGMALHMLNNYLAFLALTGK